MKIGTQLRAADDRRVAGVKAMRTWWYGLPKIAQWVVWVVLAVVVVELPVWQPPVLTTPESDFATVLFTVGLYCLAALGLNIVVGLAGLLDLGYVGFYAVGAYSVAMFASPTSSIHLKFPWLVCVPI